MNEEEDTRATGLPHPLFSRDREEALSLLQATFESTADGLLVVSRDGQVLGYNQKFLQMWNISPQLVAPDSNCMERFQCLADQTIDPEGFKARVFELFDQTPDAVVFDQLTLKDGRILERYSQPQRLNGEIVGRVWSYRDITERHRAEEALRQSEEKFRRIVEQANDVIFLLGPQGNILYSSPNVVNLSGFTPEESQAQHYSAFVHPDDVPLCEAIFYQVLTSGKKQDEIEYRSRHKNGHWIWQSASLALSQNGQSGPVVVVVTRCIDDRKQREQALQLLVEGTAAHTGEEFFKSCITHIANLLKVDAVVIGELKTAREICINTLAFYLDSQLHDNFSYGLAGAPCEQVIKDNAMFFSENVIEEFPAEEELAAAGLDSYLGLPLTSSTQEVIGILAILNRGGLDFDPDRELFLHIFAARISAELERQQTEAALRQREAKYRTIFENSQVGMGRTRLSDGMVLEANQRFADIMGYDSPAEMIDRVQSLSLYVDLDDRDRILDQLRQRGGIGDFELELRRQDGCHIWVLLSLQLNEIERCIEFVITDISERKQAEEALKQREADYRLLVEAANSIILKWDVQGNVLFMNDYGQKFFGFTAEELVGRHITENIVPLTESTGRDLAELMENICDHPDRYAFNENENCCKDGRRAWISWSNKPIVDEEDTLIGVLSVGIDVTQRRQLEENLRRSQQFLHTFIDNLPLTVFSKNVQNDFRYELINKNAERIMGFSAAEGLGKNDYELLPPATAELHRQADLEVIRTGQLMDTSKEWFRAETNEYIYLRGFKMPLYDEQGNITHLLGIAEDFTDRRRDEVLLSSQTEVLKLIAADAPLEETLALLLKNFEQLAHCSGAYILHLDQQSGRLQNAIAPNLPTDFKAALTGIEVSPASSCCGAAAYHKVPVIVADTHTDPLWQDVRELASQFNIRSCWSMPIMSALGEVMGTLSMTFDRSTQPATEDWRILGTAAHLAGIAIERKRTAAELYQAKEAAEAANRAKSQFLANMSHELRTPMNAILGFTQLMARDRNLLPQQQQSLNVINTSGKHLLDLINDVLEMSKIEAGTITLSPKPFDLRDLLSTVQSMFSIQAAEKGLALQCSIDEAVPRYVIGDEGKLRQVLINLLGNAIKFTQLGHVHLMVQPEACSLDHRDGIERLTFAIADTGPGIPDDVLPRLFQPFVQALHHVPGQGGSGLGLAITQQFIQLIGGNIAVDTTVGKGTTFTFTLPISEADPTAVAQIASHCTVQRLTPNQPAYRILVVDDRPENRDPLIQLLQSVGFDTRAAVDGRDAIAQWQTWHPHLIWMDMRMPVMDGYEATRRIREMEGSQGVGESGSEGVGEHPSPASLLPLITRPPYHPSTIIALTASAFEDQREEMLAAGCDDFVCKPFYAAEIFRKMAHHLGVQFELMDTEPHRPPPPQTVLPPSMEDVQQLPGAWRRNFHRAAIQADADWLRSLLADLPDAQRSLQPYLERLISQLDFDTLVNLMEAVPHE